MLPYKFKRIYKTIFLIYLIELLFMKLCLCIHQRYTKENIQREKKINRNLFGSNKHLANQQRRNILFQRNIKIFMEKKCWGNSALLHIKTKLPPPLFKRLIFPWWTLKQGKHNRTVYIFDLLTSIRILEIWVRHICCWRNWFLKLK